MSRNHGRALPHLAALTLIASLTACSVESPASTPTTSTPATLFAHATVEDAWQAAIAKKRPLVVFFTSDRCPHCERMLAETYANPAVRRLLLDHAETAIAHAARYRALVERLKVRGFPTTVIVSADGQIVDAVEGYLDAPNFARRLGRWIGPEAAANAQVAIPR
jgi:thioredoxin-related protein